MKLAQLSFYRRVVDYEAVCLIGLVAFRVGGNCLLHACILLVSFILHVLVSKVFAVLSTLKLILFQSEYEFVSGIHNSQDFLCKTCMPFYLLIVLVVPLHKFKMIR